MEKPVFPFLYFHSGLLVASQLELPEWTVFAVKCAGEPDVLIVLDGPLAVAPKADEQIFDDAGLHFTIEGTGRWTVANGATIRIAPAPDAQARELRLFTLGSAWGALGYQRGLAMLHGSAIAVEDGAVLFVGYSTQGKSTMAGALLARGHQLVADDLSRVDPPQGNGSAPLLHPSAARIKLWDVAIAHLGWQERPREQDHFRDNKFHLTVSKGVDRAPLPLKAIYSLDWGDQIAFSRLRGGVALQELLSKSLYRPEFLEIMGCFADQVRQCTACAQAVPIWGLERPRDFARLDAVCDALERHWSGGEAFTP